jgi:hypothetical protein
MADFIAVPAKDLEDFLQQKGYSRTTQREEVVYVKRSQVNPSLMVKVYTSICDGSAAVRAAGRDAIRVCVVFDNGARSFGVGKFSPVMRVHSAQSVLERLNIRLREAALRAREWLAQQAAPAPAHAPDYSSEPPPPETQSFEDYANSLSVPFA